jgi:hypothetical protein
MYFFMVSWMMRDKEAVGQLETGIKRARGCNGHEGTCLMYGTL